MNMPCRDNKQFTKLEQSKHGRLTMEVSSGAMKDRTFSADRSNPTCAYLSKSGKFKKEWKRISKSITKHKINC